MDERFRKMTDVWIHDTVRKFTRPSPVLKTSPSCVSVLPISMLSALLCVGSIVSARFSSAIMDQINYKEVEIRRRQVNAMNDDQLGPSNVYIYRSIGTVSV